jgi:N-methylhydantoinase A/oxoprolinase/acetone carboxylase beta subunit
MAEIKDPRGKHLLGEAVRLLVQSGATGASIADFISEYSSILDATLAAPPVAAQPDMKAQMKEALREALLEFAPPAQRTRRDLRKRVNVYVAGAKTSLSLRKDMFERTVEAVGSQKAQELAHEFANSKPDGVANRSAWVDEQLRHHLLLMKAESTLTGKTPH